MYQNKRDFLTSTEVGNAKQYDCKHCKKNASFLQEGEMCLLLGCRGNNHEIRKTESPTRTAAYFPFS
jgi:hypothetical protein